MSLQDVRGILFGRDVKARRVQRQIAVKVPANAYVTKLERSCDATTHRLELVHCLVFAHNLVWAGYLHVAQHLFATGARH
jgi:hypothetical protein